MRTRTRTRIALGLSLAAGAVVTAAANTANAAGLPLTSLTLYRSGVGYFEHAGTVQGDETLSLRFEAGRINDILKSMTLLDFDGGRITGARYEPNEPLSRRLKDFRINPLGAQSPMSLLRQLQGVKVHIRTTSGDVTGVVLGVSTQQTPISVGDRTMIINDDAVSLVTDAGVSSITQTDIRSVEILDAGLADELTRSLAAVAQHRDDRWTTIDIGFSGEGARRALAAYTHEAPVWKTSYRLILPDEADGSTTLQGWAIVENDTREDWKNVTLSLASGRPVSFVMDLQTPLILRRPVVPVPVIASLGPQVYEGGYKDMAQTVAPAERAAERRSRLRAAGANTNFQYEALAKSKTPTITSARAVTSADLINSSAQAAASAGDVGQQFIYTIDAPVSIDAGESAMLPIINAPIDGSRVSIYSWKGKDSRPLRGIELTNTAGLDLAPGPIAVYDAGAYAGDAEIGHIGKGAKRLLSYAVDFDLDASRAQSVVNNIQLVRIAGGMIRRTHVSRQTTTYTFTNNDDRPRIVMLEHPKTKGWKILGETTPVELTDTLYRFKLPVASGETQSLKVVLQRIWTQSLAVLDMDIDELLIYVKNGQASQAVLDAVSHAAGIQSRINASQEGVKRIDNETGAIGAEQGRIRANMHSIERRSDLYARYMKKLNAQETRLETIASQRRDLQGQLDAARAELRSFLKDLDVQ